MAENKRFKDPIYGYIDVPIEYVKKIIDTSEFQRLRRIIQTSYSALYSSSVHNRFIHSIGVYHLGQIASTYLLSCINEKDSIKDLTDWSRTKVIFDLACLLHDVGHSPFSHTGEKFFLSKSENGEVDFILLHKRLIEAVGDSNLRNDIPKVHAAAPHEIISAIIGIERFSEFFNSVEEKDFFARCITGYKFNDSDDKHAILNCFISLLNSKVIDVDRLDYLIRDAYFTGYQSVNIDYKRLLTSLYIFEEEKEVDGNVVKKYSLGYKKHAVSIIENVVFAHDAERKWIQTHPIILYEMYIIQHIMEMLDKSISNGDKKLFSLKTLSKEGLNFEGIGKLSLLCDDDIIFLMKNRLGDELCNEFFARNNRRHPLWKSESEYKAYFTSKFGREGTLIEKFNDVLDRIEKFLRKNTDSWIINEQVVEKIKEDKRLAEEKLSEEGLSEIERKSFNTQISERKKILPLMECLLNFSKEKGLDCDFIILNSNFFYSSFNKSDFEEIPIDFSGKKSLFKDVVSILSSEKLPNDNFFYIFYKDNHLINKNELRDAMVSTVIKD